jgi:hypothetical protein
MSTPESEQGARLLGEVEEGMPVFDLHNESIGTVSQVAPGQPAAGDIVIAAGYPGQEYAATVDQLGAVDREDGVILTVPRDDLRQG